MGEDRPELADWCGLAWIGVLEGELRAGMLGLFGGESVVWIGYASSCIYGAFGG